MFDSKSKFYLDEKLVYYLVKQVYLDKRPIVNCLNSFQQTVTRMRVWLNVAMWQNAEGTAAAQILLHR